MSCFNPWGTNNVRDVCGPTADPTVRDQGQCHPYRSKQTCEAPDVPVVPCHDPAFAIIAQPLDPIHPFKIVATLFDQNCLPITDQNNLPILTYIV